MCQQNYTDKLADTIGEGGSIKNANLLKLAFKFIW